MLEALYGEIRDKNRQLEEQAAQIAEWNARLETRVTEQVTQIGQMSKLTRFLSPKVSDLIMAGDADDPLKTRRREITVVFVDLRGFTGFTETAEPEEVMSVLREYHAELGRAIMAYDGTIEHFAGDGVMILFNDPVPVENHELQAIRMARDHARFGDDPRPGLEEARLCPRLRGGHRRRLATSWPVRPFVTTPRTSARRSRSEGWPGSASASDRRATCHDEP